MFSPSSQKLLKQCCSDHPFDICPECFQPSCRKCCTACYECVKAWRHAECGKEHVAKTNHRGWLNDLDYLVNGIL